MFFQVYWCGSRDDIAVRLDRARNAGAVGLILTLDWSFSHHRDWGSPAIPEHIDLKTAIKFGPETVIRPQWLLEWARRRELPDLTVPNMTLPGQRRPVSCGVWRVDGHTRAHVGRRRLDREGVGRAADAEGHHPS
ncbi:MAG: hypothetical protein R2710_08305 [Acidimicrobiales bacterium]